MTTDLGAALTRQDGPEIDLAPAGRGGAPEPGRNGAHPPASADSPLLHASRLLQYLPSIYSADPFMGRFLGIFEAVLDPIDEQVRNQPYYFDPATAPAALVDWLLQWVGLEADAWPPERRRVLVQMAVRIYGAQGTPRGLKLHLEALAGAEPWIMENTDGFRLGADARLGYNTLLGEEQPYWFTVTLALPDPAGLDQHLARAVIEMEKPVGTAFTLRVVPRTE